jgi:hypothetical protein
MKNYVAWYQQWEFLLELMDLRFAGPILARIAENRETEEDRATIHTSSFPKDFALKFDGPQ